MSWINTSEVARRLNKSEASIKRACVSGSLGIVCRKNGRVWEIDEDSVAIARARDVSTEEILPNVQATEEISKSEYERRIKKEDWLKRQRENKIKSGEYGKLAVLCAMVGDYFSVFYQDLRERLDKKVIAGKLTQSQAEEVWNCLIDGQEVVQERLLEKIKSAHV